MRTTLVDKFGGTSLGSAARISTSLEAALMGPDGTLAVGAAAPRRLLVVSAPAGVTDALVAAVQAPQDSSRLGAVRGRCQELLASAVAASPRRRAAESEIDRAFRSARRGLARGADDVVLAAGERVSLAIVGAVLAAQGYSPRLVDATRVMRLDAAGNPEFEAIRQSLERETAGASLVMVPGFFGADSRGRLRVLGRGASDLSATWFAAAAGAARVTIWTDTPGIWSADPNLIPSALPLESLTWAEAGRLAAAGAKVLHPETVEPVRRRGIEVVVADPRSPQGPITRIGNARSGLGMGAGVVLVCRPRVDGVDASVILADGVPEWPLAARLVDEVRCLGWARPLGVVVQRGRVDFYLPGVLPAQLDGLHRRLAPAPEREQHPVAPQRLACAT